MSNQNNVSNSDFWDECYIDGNIGWDLGEATPVFKDLCHKIKKNSSIFIPGAGNGHDPIYFAKNGHDVTAADFSIKAVENMILKSNKDNIKLNVLHADIFSLDRQLIHKFDYVIEYTCFCAIERSRRMEYIKSMHQILKKDGELIGLFLAILFFFIFISCSQFYSHITKESVLLNDINKSTTIDSFKWKNRLLIFIDSKKSSTIDYPQIDFKDYDLVIVNVINDKVIIDDYDYEMDIFFTNNDFKKYDFEPFTIILVGKDSRIKKVYNKSNFKIEDALQVIDLMPMRVYERSKND